MLCSRCKKRIAVIFVNRVDMPSEQPQAFCLQCAQELGLPPVKQLMDRMNMNPENLNQLEQEWGKLINKEDSEDGNTLSFPFLQQLFGEQAEGEEQAPPRTKEGKPKQQPERKFLETYGINLNRKAREGELDRMVGRETQIARILQILNRRQKNNPCLIGEPGVGKTAIAEGLAQRIEAGDVPVKLQGKEIYLLDMAAMVAGTQFRGQFESRMKSLIAEVKQAGNVILFIDEIHSLVGTGDAEGSMNAANILKPALSRGEIHVIGATTLNEYRKHIEKDAALERRFQPVMVEEPSTEKAFEILKGIKGYYERYHEVTLPDTVLRQAVLLSERYVTDRNLPDKAIDLVDEASSQKNLSTPALGQRERLRRELARIQEQLQQLENSGTDDDTDRVLAKLGSEKGALREELRRAEQRMANETGIEAENAAARRQTLQQKLDELSAREKRLSEARQQQLYQRRADLRSEECRVRQEIDALEPLCHVEVKVEDLCQVIELWTGIPASKITLHEYERLGEMEEQLKRRIVGQDEAIEAICTAVRRSRVDISPKKKPISMIFAGPTGVGKTELVKTLATVLSDSPDALVRLDMSEFMEKHSVSRLIGSPPGYVGYDEAGQLTEKIRRRPYSVVLFDEIEKAHPDVLNVLLQIMDDGKLTDAHGRTVNFEHVILIMTTNAGSSKTSDLAGFGRSEAVLAKERAHKALQDFLRPEFLNRVDEIIAFRPLDQADFVRICDILLSDLKVSLAERGVELSWSQEALEALAAGGYDRKYFARNLRRYLQRKVENPIATRIVETRASLQQVELAVCDGVFCFQFDGEQLQQPLTAQENKEL